MGAVGVVFVSGGERKTTGNETASTASSLFRVCDLPFAVSPPRSSFGTLQVTACQGQKTRGVYALLARYNWPPECGLVLVGMLPCLAASGMLLLKTKTMSARLGNWMPLMTSIHVILHLFSSHKQCMGGIVCWVRKCIKCLGPQTTQPYLLSLARP